jgi:hypothetical protein
MRHSEKYRNMSSEQSCFRKHQGQFTKLHSANNGIARASYVRSHKIAKQSKSFVEGEFIKDSAAILYLDTKELFENVSLSRRTVTRHVEDIEENVEQQLKDKVKDFTYFSKALDESSDACNTAQLLIFLQGITPDFSIYRGACFSAVNEEYNHR